MALPQVVILDDWQDAFANQPSLERLLGHAEVTRYRDAADSAAERAHRLANADIVVAMRERTAFDAAVFAAAPRLRLLVQTGGGLHHVDQAAAATAGVKLVTTGGPDYPVVELTIGLLIGLLRRIPWADRALHAGEWPVFIGDDCNGKTLGVLGFGRIGSGVARVAQALGMQVVAWGPTLTAERAAAGGAKRLELDDLLRAADVVSVHLRLSPESRGLVSGERLGLLKPGAWLINTARGPIVDEAAMLELLQSGQLGGAALDVFGEEPLPVDHPLRRLNNVVLTPHIGWPSAGNFAYWCERAVEHILAHLDQRSA